MSVTTLRILIFTLFPLILGGAVILFDKATSTRERKLEATLIFLFGLGVGGAGIANFIAHFFLSDIVAESIGWEAGSPFQPGGGFREPADRPAWHHRDQPAGWVPGGDCDRGDDFRRGRYDRAYHGHPGDWQPGTREHHPERRQPAQAGAADPLSGRHAAGRSPTGFRSRFNRVRKLAGGAAAGIRSYNHHYGHSLWSRVWVGSSLAGYRNRGLDQLCRAWGCVEALAVP